MGKIALEEHMLLDREDHIDRWRTVVPMIPEQFQQRLIAQLTDTSRRLEVMDQGHMGETLPFFLWRLDQRAGAFADHAPGLTPSQLVRRNIRITTAGAFSDEPLHCALDALGEDNVMYSIDYPFESMTEAAEWLDASKLDAHVRAKIEHENAQALLKLNQPGA